MTTTLNTCDEEVDGRVSFVSDNFEGDSTFEYIDHYFRLEGGKGYLPKKTGYNRWYKSNQAAILKLLEFRLKNGHCNFKLRDIPSTHHQSVKDFRRMWRDPTPTPKDSHNPISQKKIDDFRENLLPVLNALDFVWDPRDASWMDKYELLKKFHQEHHHTQVTQNLEVNGVKLGYWVADIRSNPQFHQGERKRLLDALGFEWRLVPGGTKTTRERVKGIRDSGWLAAGARASLFDMGVARGHVKVLNAYSKQFPGRKFPYPFPNNKEAWESKLIQQTKATYLWRRDLQRAYSAGVEIPPELDELLKNTPLFHWWSPRRKEEWVRVEGFIMERLEEMHHIPNSHNTTIIPGDDRRPDFYYHIFSPNGSGDIYLEIDERFHDAESIESEQRRHTAFSLYSREKCGAKTIFWIRFQSGYTLFPDANQMNTLDTVLTDCKNAIVMGNKKGIHMIMIDYPRRHYHTIANQERVVPDVDFEVKVARSEEEFRLPLFNSFQLVCTPGFDHGHDGLDESLQMEEDDQLDEVEEVEEKVEAIEI